jgi:hypothetical protein
VNRVQRIAVAGASLALAATPGVHAACGDALGPGARIATAPGYTVAYRADPAPIPLARHFGLDVIVCPNAGVAAPAGLEVDAVMPAHKHGMNYRPQVAAAGPGRYRVEGLLFHMSGEWELRFDLDGPKGRERATSREVLR